MWWEKCVRPPWQPPNIVFKIVWPLLYSLYALTLIKERKASSALYLWIGLALNLLWVPVFMVNVKVALLVLAGMIIMAGIAEYRMAVEDKDANRDFLASRAVQFAPYTAWIVFAFTLNYYIAKRCK